jgi:hypothetical protein
MVCQMDGLNGVVKDGSTVVLIQNPCGHLAAQTFSRHEANIFAPLVHGPGHGPASR